VVVDLVAVEGVQGTVLVGEVGEGQGVLGGAVAAAEFVLDIPAVAVGFDDDQVGLVAPDAVEAPAGGGEAVDAGEFERGLGLEFFEVGVAEALEGLLGFIFEDDAGGGEAVLEGGGAGAGEAFGGFGSIGECAVGFG
jgi:hypothetical protein